MFRGLLLFLVILNSSAYGQLTEKASLFCRKWQQVGIQRFGKPYKQLNPEMATVLTFKTDGSYEEVIYGSLITTGLWTFNDDSTKFKRAVTTLNGSPAPNGLSLQDTKFTTVIVTLTADTLIYGNEGYYGPEKVFGHDDWYFVPVEK